EGRAVARHRVESRSKLRPRSGPAINGIPVGPRSRKPCRRRMGGMRGARSVGCAVALLIAATGVGCGDDGPSPEQACLDVADAMGNLFVRCNLGTYDQGHDAVTD